MQQWVRVQCLGVPEIQCFDMDTLYSDTQHVSTVPSYDL